MYVKKEDVDELEGYLNKFSLCEQDESYWDIEEGSSVDFFFKRPHLILSLGFDETRSLIDEDYNMWDRR